MVRKSILVLALAAFVFTPAAFAKPKVSRNFSISAPASGVLRLVIDIPASELTIENGPAGELAALGTVTREYRKPNDIRKAQQIVDAASVRFDIQGTRAILRRQFGANAKGRRAQSHNTEFNVRVRVPRGTHLEVRQTAGQVTVKGDFGDTDIAMRAGDVSVTMPKSAIRELFARARVGDVKTDIGDRVITREGILSGATHYFLEGGRSLLSVKLTTGNVDIRLVD